ncbi:MAG: TraR/DksA C4-type zinc finger protein [Myxococcota bacterium]
MTEEGTSQFAEDDDELTEEELTYFKERLEKERDAVQARLHMRIQAMADDDNPADELDQAGKLSDQAFSLRLADKERKLLAQIEKALTKFASGDYGYCEGTGEPIGRKRLELRPWTRYSIEYKEELERAKKQGRSL